MNAFEPVSDDFFYSRKDPNDVRRGERTISISTFEDLKPGIVIAGYPDDEGIRNNRGRPGAADAPDAIRKFFYRMSAGPEAIYDFGNLTAVTSLNERHETVRKAVASALNKGHRWIGLGGGHDYGYADGAGFLDWVKIQETGKKPLVINFDAHLDVREPTPEINSGTPFFRLDKHNVAFDLVQVGIQRQCNSPAHLEWSKSRKHLILTLEDYWASHVSLDEYLIKQMGDLLLQQRPCFVSVDIDAFAWPYSIGASQSWPTGLEPKEFWPCFELLIARLDVRVLGIYETSPPLEFDYGTSKLSALIADAFARNSNNGI